MHELSLASAIVDTVERHAAGRPVTVIAMRVGTLRQVLPESLELYVDLVGRGTVCEGARLELEVVPARLACCGGEWEPPSFRCPSCGGGGRVIAGDEFLVESIQIDVGSTEPKNAVGVGSTEPSRAVGVGSTEPSRAEEAACIART